MGATPETPALNREIRDKWITKFLVHLATDRGASIFTQRNYRQALAEFARWHMVRTQIIPRMGPASAR